MNNYILNVKQEVYDDIENIRNFIITVGSKELALKYTQNLLSEIEDLTYLADTMQVSQWKTAKLYHPEARRLITKNRKWNIIYHIEDEFVVVDKIIASSRMFLK